MAKQLRLVWAMTLGVTVALASGCRVDDHKSGNGDDVKIATPFGGMSVKTDQAVVEREVGLTTYPGAVLEKKKDDKDKEAADFKLNLGSFHVGVKAISYTTPDAPEKVLEFYRKDMAKYGSVILCRGGHAVGSPEHTQDGLGCDKDHGGKVSVDEDDANEELKAGSKLHQHIVGIDPQGTGTKIGLVSLDLPGHLSDSEDKQ